MMCGINVLYRLQANYFGRSFQWKNAHLYAKGIIQIKPVCDMYLSKQFTMVSMNMMSLKMVFTPLQDTSEYISFQTLKY